jgi:hypothetical protein
MEMGGSRTLTQVALGRAPLQRAESNGHEAVVSFLKKNLINKRRPKSTTAPVADLAAQAAAEAAAAAMATLLIAEEEDQKQALPSKQGKSNKAKKQRNSKENSKPSSKRA